MHNWWERLSLLQDSLPKGSRTPARQVHCGLHAGCIAVHGLEFTRSTVYCLLNMFEVLPLSHLARPECMLIEPPSC